MTTTPVCQIVTGNCTHLFHCQARQRHDSLLRKNNILFQCSVGCGNQRACGLTAWEQSGGVGQPVWFTVRGVVTELPAALVGEGKWRAQPADLSWAKSLPRRRISRT